MSDKYYRLTLKSHPALHETARLTDEEVAKLSDMWDMEMIVEVMDATEYDGRLDAAFQDGSDYRTTEPA